MQKIIPWRRVSLHPFCRRRDFEQRFDGRCRCCCCCWCCCCCCLCCCYCCWYQSRWWRRCSSQRHKRFGPFSFSVLIAGSWRLNLVAVVRRHHVVGLHRLRQRRCRQDAIWSLWISRQSVVQNQFPKLVVIWNKIWDISWNEPFLFSSCF